MDCTLQVYIENVTDLSVLVLYPLTLLTLHIGSNNFKLGFILVFELLIFFFQLFGCLHVFGFSTHKMLTVNGKKITFSLTVGYLLLVSLPD